MLFVINSDWAVYWHNQEVVNNIFLLFLTLTHLFKCSFVTFWLSAESRLLKKNIKNVVYENEENYVLETDNQYTWTTRTTLLLATVCWQCHSDAI